MDQGVVRPGVIRASCQPAPLVSTITSTLATPLDGRVNVCARLLPSTYLSVKRAKKQLGFRTIAGTWEYIIRIGLAVAAR